MNGGIIAYCGLKCDECPAYIATQANDTDTLKKLAFEWYGLEDNTSNCICDGCSTSGRKNIHCGDCAVRTCALARQVINCAYCPEYGCTKLVNLFQHIPLARENLERIRLTL
jgi:hypothetical protein